MVDYKKTKVDELRLLLVNEGLQEDELKSFTKKELVEMHKEMTLAFELTLRLVDGGHARAWALCEKLVSLGIAPPKKDAAALGRLLAHALAHCPPPRFGRPLGPFSLPTSPPWSPI